jgi:Cu+-exporting ATPase
VPIAPGDAVFGGTLNGNGALLVRATRIGADAALAHITRLVAEAQAKKARVQRLADAVSARFVPFVLVAAALTAAGWAAVVGPEAAFLPAVAVLVVACPCALGLATPTALLVGSGRAATAGIVVRDVAALERAASLDTLVLDKTGTLTEGRPTVTDVLVLDGSDPDAVLRLAAAVERRSEHPLAGAVVAAAQALGPLPEVVDFRSAPGQGVSAVVDGREVRVGQADWISSVGVDASPFEAPSESLRAKGLTILLVSVSGRAAAVFGVVDPIRAGAAEAVGRLRAAGVRLVLATGDHAAAAGRVAAALGIDEVHAGVRPGEKAALVRRLQAAGARVGMLGDGVNDAPALAAADVGFAVGTGTDVAQQVASLTLLGGDLRRVATAISLSRATLRVVRQNLFWAFAYNILALPVAAAGLLSPVIASGLMACSSVSVVGNALRLRHVEL